MEQTASLRSRTGPLPDPLAWDRTVVRRHPRLPLLAVILVVAVYPLVAIAPWIDDASSLAFLDYWLMIDQIVDGDGSLAMGGVLAKSNEHLIVAPKLLYYLNYVLFEGSSAGLRAFSLLFAVGCAIALACLLPRRILSSLVASLAAALVIAVLVFSYRADHSWFHGFSGTVWFLANLTFLTALLAARRAARTRRASDFALATLSSLVSATSYSTGLLALPLVGLYMAWLRLPWRWVAAYALAAGALAAYVASSFSSPERHPDAMIDPGAVLASVAAFLGTVYLTAPQAGASFATAMGLASAATGVFVLYLLAVRRRGMLEEIAPWALVAAYAAGNAGVAAVTRGGFGLATMFSSRYTNVSALFAISLLVGLLLALVTEDVRRRRILLAVALLAFGAASARSSLLPINMAGHLHREEKEKALELSLALDVVDRGLAALVSPPPHTEMFLDRVGFLRRIGHVPFDAPHPCARYYGERIAPEGAAAGRLDAIGPRAEGYALARGWAFAPGRQVACVALLDGRGRVVGLGVDGFPRDDVAAQVSEEAERSGWLAVVPEPGSEPPSAAVLFEGESTWRPLGGRS